jgi:hypothetical protein
MSVRSDRGRRAAVLVAVLVLAALSWWRLPDAAADARLDRGMKAAFAAFATARALNGVVSLVQSGEVSAQVGVGMSLHPGELLDPVNDLVERFSDLMLSATVAFGVQKVLVTIGAHWLVAAALTACAIGWAVLAWSRGSWPRWLPRLFALLLMARFAVPVATLGTDLLFAAFLAPKERAAREALDVLRGQAESEAKSTAPGASAETGVVAAIRGWVARGSEMSASVDKLTAAAGRIAEHVTDLIVVFLLQTLVFPLAMAWALWQAVLAWLRAPPGGTR